MAAGVYRLVSDFRSEYKLIGEFLVAVRDFSVAGTDQIKWNRSRTARPQLTATIPSGA